MLFDIDGILIEKFDTVQITDSFRKREFVINHTETSNGREFTDLIKFQLTQDRCSLLDQFELNDPVKVTFNIRGRKWEKEGRSGYINSLEVWRIERLQGEGTDEPSGYEGIDPLPEQEYEDDLPF